MKREWLIFFGECRATAWWARAFRPGWRHVAAATYFAGTERWVYIDPVAPGLHIEVATGDEFQARYDHLMTRSTAVLRFASRNERGAMPATFYCVGAIKALLGIRALAVTPWGLHRALVRLGAETVEVPFVEPIRRGSAAGSPAQRILSGGPGSGGAASPA